MLPSLEHSTHANADLGGVAAQITDYQRVRGARPPILIIALSLVTFPRADPPGAGAAADQRRAHILTAKASFGMVALLFEGHRPTLGGPGWADILSLLGTFTIVLGLSLDDQVLIITRMREAFTRSGDLGEAITFAIDRTHRPRGHRRRLPAWLDRLMPELDVEGAAEPRQMMTVEPARAPHNPRSRSTPTETGELQSAVGALHLEPHSFLDRARRQQRNRAPTPRSADQQEEPRVSGALRAADVTDVRP